MKYIILQNSVFDVGLKPSEFMVYATLMALKDKFNGKTIASCRAIADYCGLSEKTTYLALNNLENKGLVRSKHRYNMDGNYIAKIYTIKKPIGKGFFKVDISALKSGLTPTSFMVYCFLCKSANVKNRKAVSSLNNLSNKLNMTVKTVIKAIETLVYELLISKSNYIAKNGGFACNRFTILDSVIEDKEQKFYVVVKVRIKKVWVTLTKHKNNPIDLLSQYLYLKHIDLKSLTLT